MERRKTVRNRALAGILAMTLVSVGVVVVTDAVTPDERAIEIKGLDLKIMPDQSVQALVEIAASRQEYLRGVAMTLEYNSDYLVPSDWITNEPYDTEGIRGNGMNYAETAMVVDPIDRNDPLHHLFFHTNPDLFEGKYSDGTPLDPLLFWDGDSTGTLPPANNTRLTGRKDSLYLRNAGNNKNRIHLDLILRSDNDKKLPQKKEDCSGLLTYLLSQGKVGTKLYYLENTDSSANRVVFGTLSFRVKEEIVTDSGTIENLEQQLRDMVEKFNNKTWDVDQDKDALQTNYLFRESDEENVQRQLKTIINKGTPARPNYQPGDEQHKTAIAIAIEADDVIQDVWPVKDDITINAYQAYTNGDVADLATAMQNYADSVRVKRVSGTESDMGIYWGDPVDNPTSSSMPADGPGMFIQKAIPGMVSDGNGGTKQGWVADAASPRYRFKWNGSGYDIQEETVGGFVPVNSADIYGYGKLFDPRGNYQNDDQYGHYIISQYFTYWEKAGIGVNGTFALKTFPRPVQVALHVTPIKIIDATVEKQQLTYRNHIDDVPQTFAKMELADEAKLIMDTTISGVTPTMPVDWTPTNSPNWVTGILNDKVVGVAGDGNPNYNATTPGEAHWPIGSDAIDAKTGVGDYTFTTKVTEADIQAKYPWVTVNGDYDPIESVRRIVTVKPGASGDPNAPLPRYVMWAEPYEVKPAGTTEVGVTAGDPVARLRITIARQEPKWNATTEEWDWKYVNMDPTGDVGYQFKLYMPNDQWIDKDWFGAANSSYQMVRQVGFTNAAMGISTATNVYQFNLSPGDLGTTGNLETLRQYINLGGWFGAEVLEPNETVWSDKIAGFSKPRTNIYTMSYVLDPGTASTGTETTLFDYTGNRAGLMPFYKDSDLPTFITLPADETVEVRYDAMTGSQPGEMRQFKVGSDSLGLNVTPVERWQHVLGANGGTAPSWTPPAPATNTTTAVPGEIVTYGADLFARSFAYSAFGKVVNPDTADITGYPSTLRDREAKIRVQVQDEPIPPNEEKWELTLTYEQIGDNVLKYTDGQVQRVIFDNKLEGYTYQQTVTLTVTNTGNRDIRGLHIDIPDTPNGACFRLVTPPPTSLAVGASATFQLSYIQGLTEGNYQDIFSTEPIHIWHDNSGPQNDGNAPVTLPHQDKEGFEAVLKVTKTRPYKVTVVVHPETNEDGTMDRPMGDGLLVEGITTTDGADSYSGTQGASVYEMDERFWVLTQPKDEYSLITMTDSDNAVHTWVYYIRDDDPTQTRYYLNEYTAGGPNTGFGSADGSFVSQDNPERLFWGEMPDTSVTVHIHYYEPLLSKLRLSDLHAYAWDDKNDAQLKPAPIPAAAWKENAASTALFDNLSYERPLNVYDSVSNIYVQTLFQPEKDQYVVFLEPYSSGHDNFCGVSIALRNLVTHINGIGDMDSPAQKNNVDIYPKVKMVLDDASHTVVCNDDPTVVTPPPSTAGPTTHHSNVFNAPVDNDAVTGIAQTTVTITISYDGTALIPPEGLVEREYKVRFVRRMEDDKAKHIALPGNSPYGMIENDSTITDKAAAKATFDVKHRFDFSNTAHTPKQATLDPANNIKLSNIYWPEAWEGGINYDEDETALFVYAGQEFYDPGAEKIYNNAGDYINGIDVHRSLTYVKLDTTKTTPWSRFNVDPTNAANLATIDLGTVPAVNGVIPGDTMILDGTRYDGMVDGLKDVKNIRPGIYQLRYSYTDYDGSTVISFTRPLIVLTPNGDVDANVSLTDVDKRSIQQRLNTGKALPYELPTSVYAPADGLVYKYRIVDANNDRNINNIDAGLIRRVTTLVANEKLPQFYRPTEYTYPIHPTP